MSNFDFENYSEGEWEDRGETVWSEFDWQQYLQQNDRDIEKFRSCYDKVKKKSDPVTEAASLMGWDLEDWSHIDLTYDDPNNGLGDISGKMREDEESEYDDLDPYTLHRHPVFIVTRGLHLDLKKNWEAYMKQYPRAFSPDLSWQYSNAIHHGEINAVLSIQAIDMGDYSLAICLLKSALSALNQLISIIQQLPDNSPEVAAYFKKDSLKRLFDLREVWLRMMSECREELQRRYQDGE